MRKNKTRRAASSQSRITAMSHKGTESLAQTQILSLEPDVVNL